MEMVRIFDTTLRDGEQAPGFSMNTAEKLRLARRLESLGVDVIEAGFPIASQGDFEAVREVAREIRTQHGGGAGADAAGRYRRGAGRRGTRGTAASAHVSGDFRPAPEAQAAHFARRGARIHRQDGGICAKARCPEVEFSAEDASRSDIEFLGEAFSIAADAGATILNAPDTVGYATPEEYGGMFRALRAKVGDRPGVVWSAHCHNDLGLAVANSLAAVEAGARQVECTINGIGERAGNAAHGRDCRGAGGAAGSLQDGHAAAVARALCDEPAAFGDYRTFRCRRTRPWWARMPSRTRPAFIRTES